MLQAIRSKAGSFVVKGLFGLLILIFGIWGIGDIFRTRPTDTVIATVGDQSIHAEDLQTAMRRELERLSARFGASIDIQQAKKLGIIDDVLDALIDRSLLDQEAARLRLEVSDEVIRNAITDDPKFRTPDGHFDRALFNAALAENHFSEDQFVTLMRREIPRNDLQQAVVLGTTAPQSMVDLLFRYRNEKRVADIVTLLIDDAGDVGQPSEADLTAFYDGHQDLFRAPEYRGFTLASLSLSDIAQGIEIPEAKLKEEFDERQDEFQLPEQREVQQILAPSEEKLKEAEAALAAGKDWNEVAIQIAGQNPDTIELGLMKREELPRVLSDIAFELPLNKPSEPVKTPLGWHILRIVKIEPAVSQSFEQAKPKLEAQLTHDEAVDRIYKIANRVDDALAGGMTLENAVAKFGLKKTEIDAADVGDHDPEGKPVALPVPATEVLKLVFATNEGQTSRVTEGRDGAIFMVRVSKVTPPTIKPLAEVKDQAVAAWQGDKRREKVAKTAEELAAAVKPGARLAAVAAEKGLKVTTSPPLLRRPRGVDAKLQTTTPALVAKLFEAKPDEVVIAADAAGSYVAQLGEVQVEETPSKSATVDLSLELNQGMRTDLAAEFTQALRARYPVEIRREAVDRLF
jgi:peptidyl-prolyl cis-trans isomerase D